MWRWIGASGELNLDQGTYRIREAQTPSQAPAHFRRRLDFARWAGAGALPQRWGYPFRLGRSALLLGNKIHLVNNLIHGQPTPENPSRLASRCCVHAANRYTSTKLRWKRRLGRGIRSSVACGRGSGAQSVVQVSAISISEHPSLSIPR